MPTKALCPLPVYPAPVSTKCFQFLVPDDPTWTALLWGALDQLQRWNSYHRDAEHTAAAVAEIWRQIFEATKASPCEPGPYCASWDFRTGDPGDGWSAVGVTVGGGTPSYVGDGWEVSAAATGAANQFCTIKLTTVDPITVNFARICWEATPGSNTNATQAFIVGHVDSSGNSGNVVATGSHTFNWDGCDDTSSDEFIGTQIFIQCQNIWNGGSTPVSGLLKITGVDLFGSGQPPPGATTC